MMPVTPITPAISVVPAIPVTPAISVVPAISVIPAILLLLSGMLIAPFRVLVNHLPLLDWGVLLHWSRTLCKAETTHGDQNCGSQRSYDEITNFHDCSPKKYFYFNPRFLNLALSLVHLNVKRWV
jgi:hypothetical protein